MEYLAPKGSEPQKNVYESPTLELTLFDLADTLTTGQSYGGTLPPEEFEEL